MFAGTREKGGERGWVWGKNKDAEGGRNIFGLGLVHDLVNTWESKVKKKEPVGRAIDIVELIGLQVSYYSCMDSEHSPTAARDGYLFSTFT